MASTENRPTPSPEGAPKRCPECQGRGWLDIRCASPDHAHLCSYCNGKGFDALGNSCYACHGSGRIEVRQVDKTPCTLCHGAGVYPVPASLTMKEFAYRPGTKS
jgi:hypothetical protein